VRRQRLFPENAREYRGYGFVVVILVALTVVSTGRSLVHILVPDGGSASIAGIVSNPGSSSPLIFAFAWAGIYQIIWAAVQWTVLLRYRGLVPLISLLMLVEQAALFLLPHFKPIASTSLTHTPPEAIGNKILLPLMVIVFVVSLIPKRQKGGVNRTSAHTP
jgi:hypothetical protein